MIKKLVTFEDLGFVQWGVLDESETGVYGAIALEEAFFTPLPETLLEFIRQGNDGILALADALEQNEKAGAVKAKPLDTVRIMAPFPTWNGTSSVSAKTTPTTSPNSIRRPCPTNRNTRSSSPSHVAVIGPDDPIEPHKNVTEQVDYEANWPSSSVKKARISRSAKPWTTSTATPS